MIGGLVLAAGDGRRFGGRKMLADLAGQPLLTHVLTAMSAAPLDRVACVLGAGADEILQRIDFGATEALVCESWAEGQAASLQTGFEALIDADAIVVALGDQPRLSPSAIARVIGARGGDALAVRATYDGIRAHPTLIERPLFDAVLELRGDSGARELLASTKVREIPCDGLGSAADVDTLADLAALRKRMAPSDARPETPKKGTQQG